MLLDLPGEVTRPRFGRHWPLAAAAGLSFAALAWLARVGDRVARAAERMADETPARGSLSKTGAALFGPFALPFEISSLVLLAAIVGAVVLPRKKSARS